jgi:hypothetical protein
MAYRSAGTPTITLPAGFTSRSSQAQGAGNTIAAVGDRVVGPTTATGTAGFTLNNASECLTWRMNLKVNLAPVSLLQWNDGGAIPTSWATQQFAVPYGPLAGANPVAYIGTPWMVSLAAADMNYDHVWIRIPNDGQNTWDFVEIDTVLYGQLSFIGNYLNTMNLALSDLAPAATVNEILAWRERALTRTILESGAIRFARRNAGDTADDKWHDFDTDGNRGPLQTP